MTTATTATNVNTYAQVQKSTTASSAKNPNIVHTFSSRPTTRERRCISVNLPQPGSQVSFGSYELGYFAGEFAPEQALEIMVAGGCGLVVYDDGMQRLDVDVMAVAASFLAVAAGALSPTQRVFGFSRSLYDEKVRHAGVQAGAVYVADLCRPAALESAFATIGDFFVDGSYGYDDVEYVGTVPQPVLDALGTDDVQEAVLHAYFDALGANERMDVPDGFDVLGAMSFGERSLDPSFLDWEMRRSGFYAPLVSSCAIAERTYKGSPGYRRYRELIDDIRALAEIWKSYQEDGVLGVRIGRRLDEGDEPPAPEKILASMKTVSDLLGVEAAVKAYLGGVPTDDILA